MDIIMSIALSDKAQTFFYQHGIAIDITRISQTLGWFGGIIFITKKISIRIICAAKLNHIGVYSSKKGNQASKNWCYKKDAKIIIWCIATNKKYGHKNNCSNNNQKSKECFYGGAKSRFFIVLWYVGFFVGSALNATSKAIPTALSLIWRCFHGARSEIKNLAYQYSRKGKVFHRGAMC